MSLKFEIDEGLAGSATLGLVVLQTDETIEHEFREFAKYAEFSLYHSRVPSDPLVTPETLARMEAEIPAAVALLPREGKFDVIGYACTSGATVIGEEQVGELIRSVRPGVATSNPLSAVKAALHALGIRRLGFVTPYVADISLAMRQALEENGIEISAFGSFEQLQDHLVARISERSVLDAVLEIGGKAECDGIFVSCTNLRTCGILAAAEKQLGKPVISSNQALGWHMLRLAGVSSSAAPFGKLFDCDLPKP